MYNLSSVRVISFKHKDSYSVYSNKHIEIIWEDMNNIY